ncbi:MAG: hypothetical protein MMC33_004980 [Icmadophila ericetorum]|nr:hypothetical protein [Icmadophila ericetorum]
MAADSREPTQPPQSPFPTTSTSSKPSITLPLNANALPLSASQNTAGHHGPPSQPTFLEAISILHPSDLTTLHEKPCVRDALLFGIASGFGVGGLRGIIGSGRISGGGSGGGNVAGLVAAKVGWAALSWAVGTFCVGSMGMHVFCQRRRELELGAMRRAREIVERKRVEREMDLEGKRRLRREEKERRDADDEAKRRKEERDKMGRGWRLW